MAKRRSSRSQTATFLAEAVPLKFDQKLVLLQWMLWLFDKKNFEQLAEPFKSAELEGLNEDNNHKFPAVFRALWTVESSGEDHPACRESSRWDRSLIQQRFGLRERQHSGDLFPAR